jgi:hypothetical protein
MGIEACIRWRNGVKPREPAPILPWLQAIAEHGFTRNSSMNLDREARAATADVSEGFCPLCRVRLIPHDGRACCPCGGCSYQLEGERLEMTTCELHPAVTCEHWRAVWEERRKLEGT